ncbi:MAG: dynamin family protein [Mailhella sp.]|nr:dynamin family protein [Mailhella sp.]
MKEQAEQETKIAASAADILPGLVSLDPLRLSGEDRLLVLLASAAHFDGRLSPAAWQAATRLLHEVFDAGGSSGRSFSTIQARFHAALLLDPVPPESFARDASLAAEVDALPAEKAERLRRGVMELCPAYGQMLSRPGQGAEPAEASRPLLTLPFGRRDGQAEGDKGNDEGAERIIMKGGLAVPQSRRDPLLPEALQKGISTGLEALARGATTPYHWASRYFGAMNVMRLFPLFGKREHEAPVPACFRETAGSAEALERLSLSAGDVDLFQQAADFGLLMREQPFTVVMAGEGKRGKSSLVNALLGREVSPVRESMAATAAVVRFRWGEKFRGRARPLSGEERARLESVVSGGSSSADAIPRGQDGGEGEWIGEASRLAGLLVQAHPGGEGRSAYAEVEMPAELLRGGLVLVDTPGLNAASDVQNYLAYQACLEADCLVFVMDARRPESASETELMRLVAKMGRAAGVIGVVTGMDRLNEKTSRELALGEARRVLAAAQEEGLTVLGLLDINAREAMSARCGALARSGGAEFQRLRALIMESHAAGARPGPEVVSRVRLKGEALARTALEQAPVLLKKELAALPDAQHDVFLASHKDRLHKVLEKCAGQAQAVARAAAVDIESWRREQERSLDEWEETTVLRIMDAAGRHADELGGSMFSAKKWKEFNETVIPGIARDSLNELLIERRSLQRDWNEKLRQFSGAMREISVLCLDAVIVEDKELTSVKELSLSRTLWLVQANDMLKKIGLVGSGMALHSIGGLGLGLGAALGGLHWWAMVPVALVGGLIWLLRRAGDPARCRRIFLDKKEESIRAWTARQKKRLAEVLDENFGELTAAYRQAAEESLMPAIFMLAEEEASISVYLKVLEKMRADAGMKAQEMQEQARALTVSLERLEAE